MLNQTSQVKVVKTEKAWLAKEKSPKFTEVITLKFVFTLGEMNQLFVMYERCRKSSLKISIYSEKGFYKKRKIFQMKKKSLSINLVTHLNPSSEWL